MNLLAIDTSTECATVALTKDGAIYFEEQTNLRQHAQCLLPMVDKLLMRAGCDIAQLDGIVFGCGPGSFTGLRITCSVVKGLAYAHDLPLFPVGSLQAIAEEVYHTEVDLDPSVGVLAILDARMHEVYWMYCTDQNIFQSKALVSPAAEVVVPFDAKFILAGVGIDIYTQQLPIEIQSRIIKSTTVFPKAEAMIRLVAKGMIIPINAEQASPFYVRNQVTHGESRG